MSPRRTTSQRPAQGKRRAYGQHFLKDPKVISAIVDRTFEEAQKAGARSLLEIGPGRGALTLPILQTLKLHGQDRNLPSLTLAERDRELIELWQRQAGDTARILAGDFLDQDESAWLETPPLVVVSNLPYSAGTAIFTRLATHPDRIPAMVLMFQAEVAKRLRAEPSTPDRGSLTLWTQNAWDVQKLLTVPPGAFSPPPQVQSEVVVLHARSTPRIDGTREHPDLWQKLLKLTFAHRRKMLRSNLKGPLWGEALVRSRIDPTLRAEALDWAQWSSLFQAALAIQRQG